MFFKRRRARAKIARLIVLINLIPDFNQRWIMAQRAINVLQDHPDFNRNRFLRECNL